MKPQRVTSSDVVISGTTYFPASRVAQEVGVSRTTLWRWRHEGKIPPGRRYRRRMTLYSLSELQAVREYAERLEPIDPRGMQLDS